MPNLNEEQLLLGLLAISAILVIGRGSAEIARRLRQPEVLGELIGGFLLGPSVIGAILSHTQYAEQYHKLFHDPAVGVALSMFSWVGAILLLLIAGLEADLVILRQKTKPGALAALLAIVPSIAAGIFFGRVLLGETYAKSFFLGVVLSVTAVSVAAKILIERDSLRRGYAQVILAAGIASEIVVWLLVSVVASSQTGSPIETGLRSAGCALIFLAAMLTLGRRFTFWAMRRVNDLTQLIDGQLSLVVVLAFISAAITQILGLHALLGAFVFGLLLSKAPRATLQLKEKIQTPTIGFFAPIFFVLAGMRVDIFQLAGGRAIAMVFVLFVLATAVKAGLAAVGARLGNLRWREAMLVGIGVNLKGGTDVIVAILGVELGLLTPGNYTMYTVVAILTVLVCPPLLGYLEKGARPTPEEAERLELEEAKRRAYLSDIERVLVPILPDLESVAAASIVHRIAQAKQAQKEIFDITELAPTAAEGGKSSSSPPISQDSDATIEVTKAEEALGQTKTLKTVELTKQQATNPDALQAILQAAEGHNLIAIGAHQPRADMPLSLGDLQDRLIGHAMTDVLVAVQKDAPSLAGRDRRLLRSRFGSGGKVGPRQVGPLIEKLDRVERILSPVNGLEYSMAAGDVAAHLAKSYDAELVLLNITHARLASFFWQEDEHRVLLEAGYRALREMKFRSQRLGVRVTQRVRISDDPGQAIIEELRRGQCQLVVFGAVRRHAEARLHLGSAAHAILTHTPVPAIVLISHQAP